MNRLSEFFTQRLKRGFVRRLNNLKVADLARRVESSSPAPAGQPVVFFKASTGIDDLSWNSGFHLLASWSLRLKGIPVAYFACNAGLSKCVLGTNRDQPQKAMPCQSCLYQSKALYAGVPTANHQPSTFVNWFTFERDLELSSALEELSLSGLMILHGREFR